MGFCPEFGALDFGTWVTVEKLNSGPTESIGMRRWCDHGPKTWVDNASIENPPRLYCALGKPLYLEDE